MAAQLDRIGQADEIEIAQAAAGGRPGRRVTIWVVPHGGRLYVRSWRGTGAAWYRAVKRPGRATVWAAGFEARVRLQEPSANVESGVDAAFRSKYRRAGAEYVEAMVSEPARSTTLELLPEAGA